MPPARSTTRIPCGSRSATRSPSGDTRSRVAEHGRRSTRPTGYSSWNWPSRQRRAASSRPSGDQSASSTLSSTGRSGPPDSGTVASVPSHTTPRSPAGATRTASSLCDETLSSVAGGRPRETDAGLSSRREKSSGGPPSHSALYTTVWPSRENLALVTTPRRNVSCVNRGGGAGGSRRASHAPAAAASRRATAVARARHGGRRKGPEPLASPPGERSAEDATAAARVVARSPGAMPAGGASSAPALVPSPSFAGGAGSAAPGGSPTTGARNA